MMNLERNESEVRESPFVPDSYVIDFEAIELQLDLIPSLFARRIENLSVSENESQSATLKGLNDELTNLKEKYSASVDHAIRRSRVKELESDAQASAEEIERLVGEVSAAKSTIGSLSLTVENWERERRILDEEIQVLRTAIVRHKSTSSVPKIVPGRTRPKAETKNANPNNELISKIFKLQAEIRLRQKQLEISRSDPELSNRIRMQHVCRGVIETSPNLSPEMKSKLLSRLILM